LSTIDQVQCAGEVHHPLRNQFANDRPLSVDVKRLAGDPSGGGQIETWVPPVCARGDRNPKVFHSGLAPSVLNGGRASSLRGTNRHQKDGLSETERPAITDSDVFDKEIFFSLARQIATLQP